MLIKAFGPRAFGWLMRSRPLLAIPLVDAANIGPAGPANCNVAPAILTWRVTVSVFSDPSVSVPELTVSDAAPEKSPVPLNVMLLDPAK
jgi:hypothetical protein